MSPPFCSIELSATSFAYIPHLSHARAANNAPTQYAFSLSLQIVFPFLTRLPRFLLPIVGTAIYLPIAIAAAAHFASALSNFLGLLGYWSSIFVAILLVEVSLRSPFSVVQWPASAL